MLPENHPRALVPIGDWGLGMSGGTNKSPRVSVLMPAHNAEQYIRESIESILSQTFRDFELLVLDDGSTDSTAVVARSYLDERLKLITNEANLGIIGTLNRGLNAARGEYVARMDADDVSAPDRFAKQVAFLDQHPDVAVVGTWFRFINHTGRQLLGCEPPYRPDDVRNALLFQNCIAHPSVMFRRSVVLATNGYDPSALYAEDYALWLSISERHDIANLPEYLLMYRVHPNQVSLRKLKAQWRASTSIRNAARSRMGQMKRGEFFRRIVNELRAGPGSLGRSYLDWSGIYAVMGEQQTSDSLSARGLLYSPLAPEMTLRRFCGIPAGLASAEQMRALRWYKHRLSAYVTRK